MVRWRISLISSSLIAGGKLIEIGRIHEGSERGRPLVQLSQYGEFTRRENLRAKNVTRRASRHSRKDKARRLHWPTRLIEIDADERQPLDARDRGEKIPLGAYL